MNANDIQSVFTRSCCFMSAPLIYPPRVCVPLRAIPGPPADTANVLRGLSSSQNWNKLAQIKRTKLVFL